MNIVEQLLNVAASALLLVFAIRSIVYRAYFFKIQRGLGKNPYDLLRKELPLIWWLL